MKKTFFITAIMAVLGIGLVHAEEQWIAHDRSDWKISGCSQYGHGSNSSNDGNLSEIIDDSTTQFNGENSYWHTEYDNDNAKSGHFFIIDRGEGSTGTPFGGFGFSPRHHEGGNGFLVDYSVYVTDDVTGVSTVTGDGYKYAADSHSSLQAFLTGKEKAASGTIDPRFDATSDNYATSLTERRIKFARQQTGRYVIFVFEKTSGTNDNKTNMVNDNNHANCADFKLYDVWEREARSDWNISGCSQYGASGEGQDGPLSYIFDDNPNTFWHSNWESGDANNSTTADKPHAHHFFIIDRGENAAATSFGGFGFLPRKAVSEGNGYLKEYSLYAVDNIDGITTVSGTGKKGTSAAHNTLDAFLSGKTAAATGTITPEFNREDASTIYERRIKFEQQQVGRYVIFIFEETTGAQDNNHANCAEFYLYNTAVVPNPQPADVKASALAKLEEMRKAPVIWQEAAVDEAITRLNALDEDATQQQVSEILAGAYNSAIGKTVNLLNVSGITNSRFTPIYLYAQGSNVNVLMPSTTSLTHYSDLAIYWTITGTDTPGVYRLENYSHGSRVGFSGIQNSILQLQETGAEFEILVPDEVDNETSVDNNQIVFRSINHRNQDVSCIHCNESHSVMGWLAISAGSQWRAAIPSTVSVNPERNGTEWIISYANGITLNTTRNAGHRLTITPATASLTREADETAPTQEVELVATEDGNGYKLNLSNVAAGEYTVQAPMGLFSLNNGALLSRAINTTIQHQSVTSIDEISTDEQPDGSVWYDLSGRRVANPVKGFYISSDGKKIHL